MTEIGAPVRLASLKAPVTGMPAVPVVVGTVMSNGGLEAVLARDGIRLVRSKVGDRYVWEAMEKEDALFGGEPSGHVIFRKVSTAGDGILTALELLHLLRSEGRALHELAADLEHWPQVTRNVRAPRRNNRVVRPRAVRCSVLPQPWFKGGVVASAIIRPSGCSRTARAWPDWTT